MLSLSSRRRSLAARLCFVAGAALSTILLPQSGAHAQLIPAVSATGTGTFNNAPSLIIDGFIPVEASQYNASTNVHWSTLTPQFTVDLGGLYIVQDLLFSVDNNDSYLFQYSTDNVSYTTLFNLASTVGEIGGGMDTFSTVLGNAEYEATIDFLPVQARYIRATATGGDNLYSIGEIQSFGTVASVAGPEPGALALLVPGMAMAGGLLRKRR